MNVSIHHVLTGTRLLKFLYSVNVVLFKHVGIEAAYLSTTKSCLHEFVCFDG